MQLVGIQIYNLDIARIKNQRNEVQQHVSALDNSHLQVVHESSESSYRRFNMVCVKLLSKESCTT